MSSPSSQPFSYDRFDPLNDANEETNLPAIDETASGAVVTAIKGQTSAGIPNEDKIANSNSETVSDIEARRARHLLDRAFALWEKGDNSGAILACRQSLTIAPDAVGAYSMLGLLLERAGDVKNAIAAYDKAVEIEPSSVLERDSAKRLRAASQSNAAPMFHFEDAELYDTSTDDISTDDLPALAEPASAPQNTNGSAPAPSQTVTPAVTQIAAQTPNPAGTTVHNAPTSTRTATAATPTNEPNTPPHAATTPAANGATTPATSAASTSRASASASLPSAQAPSQASGVANALGAGAPRSAVAATSVPSGAATAANIATVAPRVVTPASTTAASVVAPVVTPSTQRPPAVASPVVMTRQAPAPVATRQINPSPMVMPSSIHSTPTVTTALFPESAPKPLLWQSALTFWMRSLPLAAVAGTGFLFMLWSRGVALDRERQAASTASVAVINTLTSTATSVPLSAADAAPLQNANAAKNMSNTNAANANTSSTGSGNVNSANTGGVKSAAAMSGASSRTSAPATSLPAPYGLIVNNAPAKTTGTNVTNSTNASRTGRVETQRERRARRAEDSNDSSREAERATSNFPRVDSSSSSARLIPPASVSDLPRSSSDASGSAASTGALPPIIEVPSSDGGGNSGQGNSQGNGQDSGRNGGTQADSGPLPSFPPPSQVQSRTQNQMGERQMGERSMGERSPYASPENSSAVRAADTAYKYQTRALIYVEQGNNIRAVSDFQSAMALYRRQIARGENVDDARRGLEACRDGLKLITVS